MRNTLSLLLLFFATTTSAHAGDLQAELGAGAHTSTWKYDYGGGGYLKLAYRTNLGLGVDFAAAEHASYVDARKNSALTIGVHFAPEVRGVRPLVRSYFIHQHEQAYLSARNDPWGSGVGVGSGIRHRAGFGFGLGVEIPVVRRGQTQWYVLPATTADVFLNTELGPLLYVKAVLAFGATYSIPGLP
jgi:hypothetical protein